MALNVCGGWQLWIAGDFEGLLFLLVFVLDVYIFVVRGVFGGAMSSSNVSIQAAVPGVLVDGGLMSARGAAGVESIVPDPAGGNSTAQAHTRTAHHVDGTWQQT